MKKSVTSILTLTIMALTATASDTSRIKLDPPQIDRGLPVMTALSKRHSERVWADKPVSMRDLSNLLWAADGVNRPDGKRTAPSALGKNDIDIYVFTPEGAYHYLPDSQEIELVAEGDHRDIVVGGQPNITQLPPLAFVYVSTPARFGVPDRQASDNMGYVDGGMVSQNVGIACAGLGLVNVPRYTMDRAALTDLLHLQEGTLLVLNDLIGYPRR